MKIILKITCLLISVLVLLFCAGCGNNNNPSEEGTLATKAVDTDKTLAEGAVLSQSQYRLGDKMGDYQVTDINGVTYRFSDLLKEKKAIVLNFWFINCGPCRMEFPYMEEAYQKYKSDLEILAINPVGESEADIRAFAEEMGLSFPVAAGDQNWNTAVNIQGFPTTVIIDRTGTVSFVHTGYIDSTETFERVFEFFTAEGYTPAVVENISDIN